MIHKTKFRLFLNQYIVPNGILKDTISNQIACVGGKCQVFHLMFYWAKSFTTLILVNSSSQSNRIADLKDTLEVFECPMKFGLLCLNSVPNHGKAHDLMMESSFWYIMIGTYYVRIKATAGIETAHHGKDGCCWHKVLHRPL